MPYSGKVSRLTAKQVVELLLREARGETTGAQGVRREVGVQKLGAHVALPPREQHPCEVLQGPNHAAHLGKGQGRTDVERVSRKGAF